MGTRSGGGGKTGRGIGKGSNGRKGKGRGVKGRMSKAWKQQFKYWQAKFA